MGADILGAHARLASIDGSAAGPVRLLEEFLEALLQGAGVSRGIVVDPAHPARVAFVGQAARPRAAAILTEALSEPGRVDARLPPRLTASLFEEPPCIDPRAIPLTAGEELLLIAILDGPPLDPIGFASVAAHAAALLSKNRMAEKMRGADFELKIRVWELESLYDVGLSIAGTLDMESLADDILMKSVSLLNARKGTLLVRDISGDGRLLV
ncbi:MAG: hypothetical protein ABIT01_17615, partial [Thermoanaerobaculia bacterium]